eukprot:395129-Lingulodinium_polyedra.AAC.1
MANQKEEGVGTELLWLKEWVVSTKCVAHACHNSLKWAMQTMFPGGSHLDDLWEVFAVFATQLQSAPGVPGVVA